LDDLSNFQLCWLADSSREHDVIYQHQIALGHRRHRAMSDSLLMPELAWICCRIAKVSASAAVFDVVRL